MSVKTRFLSSVSGVALTAVLMAAAMPAQADSDSANGTAQALGPGFNQNTTVTTIPFVEAISSDPANTVEVTGIVYGDAAFNHLNAIGVYVDQFDIEASEAFDSQTGLAVSALASNSATVSGSIIGTLLNPDFAPGSGSYGVRVAGNIEADDAQAFGSYVGAGDPVVTAIARNTISAAGTVAGSAIDSFGVRVDGDVHSTFARTGIFISNFGDPTDIANASAQALNVVSIAGQVGGEGASDGSVGFYVGGDVYADDAIADGSTFINIPQLGFVGILGSSVSGAGQVLSDSVARNTVEITGAVIGDGGNLATGVHIGGNAFAEGAFAAGEALSDGFQDVASAAYNTLTATNSVAIEGTVSGVAGPATGVRVGEVFAEGAGVIGEAVAAFTPGEGGTTPTARAEIAAVAGNAVSITGIVSAAGGVGVDVDGSVYAEGAMAEGFAGANIYEGSGVPVAAAVAAAQASNTVVVTGLAQANDAIGVAIGSDVYAEDAETDVVANAFATFAAAPEGVLALADASTSVTSVASNAVTVVGSVDAGLTNAIGVDPDDITAEDAAAYYSAYAFANSAGGLGALANVAGSGLASNAVAVTGTIGNAASGSTGVALLGEVEAQDAYARNDYSTAEAIQTNSDSVSAAGATATAVNDVAASNSAVVKGILGDSVTGSTGVDIGQDVDADDAYAESDTWANATVIGGGAADALATATDSISASNLASVLGSAGNNAVDSFGVRMDGFDSELWESGVDGEDAYADGYMSSSAYNYGGAGNATATAAIDVRSSNEGSVTGILGDDAENSFGVWIGEGHVAARDSSAFGDANAWAQVSGQGDATATSATTLSASNLAVVAATLGNAAVGSTGVWLGEGGVEAVFAEGIGESYSYATLAGGDDSNALAEADSSITAANVASVAVVLGDEASESNGAWISEGVGAFGAFGEGSASAYAYNQATAGNATATATNTVEAQNRAAVAATLGNDAVNSAGVYIGEGVVAIDAFAEGSTYAEAQTANGLASATATNDASASNIASLTGVLGSGAEGSAGIVAADGSLVFVPFGFEVEVGAAAINAFAEGHAEARASVVPGGQGEGGAGTAEATATNNVSAGNLVAITGLVGADGVESAGATIGEGSVMAAFAEAIGRAEAYANVNDTISGNATAQADGSVVASNAVTIAGTVGDASFHSYGVFIDQGEVDASVAEGSGRFYAEATRGGDENGDATAGVGVEGAAASVVAANTVDIGGTTSGVNAEGGGFQNNFGVYVDGDAEAVDAFAEGNFAANAYRNGSGDGAAVASVFGDVTASNAVVITGAVTAGASAEGAAGGEGSSGVWIGDDVRAEYAEAFGNAYAYADRSGAGEIGDATARASLGTSAVNAIVITGEVASYNDDSTGVHVGDSVAAVQAFAEGSANAFAYNNGDADGSAIANATNGVEATNVIVIGGEVGVGSSSSNNSTGVYIGEGVEAIDAFAEGSAYATAQSNDAGDGNATATAANASSAVNSIAISGVVGDDINDESVGVYIGEGVTARSAFAEGSAFADAARAGAGAGIATATASDATSARNVVSITGSVGVDTWDAYGVDPLFVDASGANASSSATAYANGPAGSTATATAAATAVNVVVLSGSVAGNPTLSNQDSTGIWVGGDVTAFDAEVTASTEIITDGAATGTATITATASNQIAITGLVGANGQDNVGVDVAGSVSLGGLGMYLTSNVIASAGTTGTATATGTMTNVAAISGAVGDDMLNSQGVRIAGGVLFGGDAEMQLSTFAPGAGAATALQVIEAMNVAAISGTVGANSSGSQGVQIGGNVEVTNDLVSNFVIAGVDNTNDGTTRGVRIDGSVLTGDEESSQFSQTGYMNAPEPAIPDPLQIGDYVELAGSVFIGANGGLNPYGVAVGDGNDTVLVRDTHFQMDVVNGFDGGDNEVDGQDVIVFDNAQTYVSKIDNFEVMNVTNRSAVILTNPAPYIYAVQDEVNVNYHGILSFGDGGAPPPPPIAGSSPVDTLRLDTPMLTIGGIAGVKTPGPGFDDSILKAENNGGGSYEINGDVFNFGTITLSKVLSPVRGTDPHGMAGDGATSFDEPAEQQFWTTTGSWALDPNSAAGDRLVINGNYTAGSNIIVDAFVFKTGSASDTVVINGNVAGLTTIWVNNTNAFGPGAQTGHGPTDGILLVDVNNAQDPAAVGQAFVLGNNSGWGPEEMQVGAFIYDLRQGGGDGRDFYLQSELLDTVPGYTVIGSALRQHFYAELGTLYQRMGELRHADTGPKANSPFFEFWLRAYGQDVELDPKKGFGFDMNSKGFMVGGDYAIRNWVTPQSRLHLGGFGGFGTSKIDDIKGGGDSDGKIDSYTLGLYATYFDTAKKGQGFYADAVAKINFLDSEITSSARSTKAKSDDFAWGASLEVGYGIGLGNGFIIQPQGQLTYMQVGKEKFKESKTPGIPLEIEREKAESLRGRLGLQLQNTWTTSGGTQFSPYVIGNVLHEFMGDSTTTVSGTEFRNDMGGTWYNAGAGFSLDFDNVGLYGHVEYNFGDRVEGIGAGLGVKVRLGGATPVAATPKPAPAPAVAPKKNFLVFFDFDRSNITSDAQRVIDEAVSAAKAGNVARVQLTGHTDRSGSEQYNLALSLRRGEAVKQALIARGIPAASISIIGRGESQPLVPTADGVREPQNRRVEILL